MFKKVLVLAPHTDDGELGCGGSIVRFIEEGSDVYYIAFSICEESVSDKFPKDILSDEVKKATKQLGIKDGNLVVKKYPVRRFQEHRQDILDDMIKIKSKIRPDIVFIPSSYDIHQDHQVIHQEAKRAFKFSTILGYEFMWNNYEFKTGNFIILKKKHIKKKIDAIKKYKSQEKRFYSSEESLKGLARYRGLQIGEDFAEAFEVIRWVLK